MSISLKHIRVEGWPAVVLENDALRVVVIPELGGKIISLRSQRTGREWLWENPYLPLAKPPLGVTNFGLYDSGGWDEIFPTVNSCQVPHSGWGKNTLKDHGELWFRPWRMLAADLDKRNPSTLTLSVDEPGLPFHFQRTLKLAPGFGSLEFIYKLTNLSELPLPYLWAAHPLVAIEPGNEILLPTATTMSSTGNVGLELSTDSVPFAWPTLCLASGRSIDLSRVPERDAGFAIKLFAKNVTPPTVQIVDNASHDRLQFSFASSITAHCALWLNYGAWSGAHTVPYFNLGLEPTTTPYDDLAIAASNNHATVIAPGECHRWNLTVSVHSHHPT